MVKEGEDVASHERGEGGEECEARRAGLGEEDGEEGDADSGEGHSLSAEVR